jgi:hypothetical protein
MIIALQSTQYSRVTKFEAFTAVKIQVEFWVVTPCSVVVGYQRPLKWWSYHSITRHHNQEELYMNPVLGDG